MNGLVNDRSMHTLCALINKSSVYATSNNRPPLRSIVVMLVIAVCDCLISLHVVGRRKLLIMRLINSRLGECLQTVWTGQTGCMATRRGDNIEEI